jgi:hypothetical protein
VSDSLASLLVNQHLGKGVASESPDSFEHEPLDHDPLSENPSDGEDLAASEMLEAMKTNDVPAFKEALKNFLAIVRE